MLNIGCVRFLKTSCAMMIVGTALLLSCNDKKVSTEDLSKKVLPLDSAVLTGTLENGLKYYIRQNKNPEKRAIMYLANKIGSAHETDDQRGVAHFVEHMAFRGTKNFPKNELINFLEKSGVKFGADLNAHTGYLETVYKLPLPSTDPDMMEKGFLILRDWATDVEMKDEAVNAERNVILAEMRQREGLSQRIRRQSLPSLLNGAIYADRSPVGIEEVVKNVTTKHLQEFYDKWYRPNLQALVVVGDFDPKQIEQMIKSKFGDLTNPENAEELPTFEIPTRQEDHYQIIKDEEISNTTIQILNKKPEVKGIRTELELRNAMLYSFFNSMMANRIKDLRRGGESPFLSASVHFESLFSGLTSASANITINTGEAEKGVKTILREIRRVKEYGFTKSELDRAKTTFIERQDYQFGERLKASSQSYMARYVEAFISGFPYSSAEFYNKFYHKHLATITEEEVANLIQDFYDDTNRDFYILTNASSEQDIPSQEQIEQWKAEVEKEIISNVEESNAPKKLMDKLPQPGKIQTETTEKELGITTWILSNGAKVVIKPTTFRNDQILFSSFSPGGTSLYDDNTYQSAVDAVGILVKCGVGDLNQKELARALAGKILQVGPYIGEGAEGVNGSSSVKDLETALQLMHLYITQPRLDKKVVQNILKESKERLKKRYAKPANVFVDTISTIMSGNHPRKRPASPESVDKVDADRALEIYRERFADASDFTFVFVGNIDLKTFRPLVEQYIASLPGLFRKEKANPIQLNRPQGALKTVVKKGKTDRASVCLILDGAYEVGNNVEMNMTALRDIVRLRMVERLRAKENQVYSPSVSINLNEDIKRYEMRVNFVCSPQYVDQLINSVKDEYNKLAVQGARADEIVKFKSEFESAYKLALQKNDYWLSEINSNLKLGRDLNNILSLKAKMEQVNAETFKATAAKYLKIKSMKEFVLLPE